MLSIFKGHRPYIVLGLAGVGTNEPRHVKQWNRFFSFSMIFVAIVLLWQWHMEMMGELNHYQVYLSNCLVWSFFFIEWMIMLILVQDRWRYLRQNWMHTLLVACGLAFVLRLHFITAWLDNLRPILAIYIMLPSIRVLLSFLADGKLGTTLFASLVIIIVFGILAAGVDPGIHSIFDGVWWAIATVSTVGYGDVVPTSTLGRVIGAILIVMGLGIFVVITANFLAIFLKEGKSDFSKAEHEIDEMSKRMKHMAEEQNKMAAMLGRLENKLSRFAKKKDKQKPDHHGDDHDDLPPRTK